MSFQQVVHSAPTEEAEVAVADLLARCNGSIVSAHVWGLCLNPRDLRPPLQPAAARDHARSAERPADDRPRPLCPGDSIRTTLLVYQQLQVAFRAGNVFNGRKNERKSVKIGRQGVRSYCFFGSSASALSRCGCRDDSLSSRISVRLEGADSSGICADRTAGVACRLQRLLFRPISS